MLPSISEWLQSIDEMKSEFTQKNFKYTSLKIL